MGSRQRSPNVWPIGSGFATSGAADIRQFARFAGIDWSGQAVARPRGIALAVAETGDAAPVPVTPPGGWSRQAILDWLIAAAEAGEDMLVGIDLSPSLPFADRGHFLSANDGLATAPELWARVDALCGDEPHLAANRFVHHATAAPHFRHWGRDGLVTGAAFEGPSGRLRVTERACRADGYGSACSVFNLIGAAQVGKSSLTGMRLLHRLRGRVPVWPFDPVPATGPLIVEIYTTVAARAAGLPPGRSKLRDATALDHALTALDSMPHAPLPLYDDHLTDAMIAAAWLRRVAVSPRLWSPAALSPALACTEGWTFGIV